MSFTCGIVGLPGVGKTTIFNAITSAGAATFGKEETNRAVVQVPDKRIQPLADMYGSSKLYPAFMEVVDIPGLKSGSTAQGGRGSKLLGHIKNVDALIHVVRCFEDESLAHEYSTIDPIRDVETIDLEMVIADSQTVQNKIERLAKRMKSGDPEIKRDLEICEKIKLDLDNGIPVRNMSLSEREIKAIFDCNLVSLKPVMYVANIKNISEQENKYVNSLKKLAETSNCQIVVVSGRDEADISQLDKDDQEIFLAELGLAESSMSRLIRAAYKTLGLLNFFTAGPKEIHVWTCNSGSKAPQAAGKIHSDMEKGFIRMEVMSYDDLMSAGSEAQVAKNGKLRIEGKDYEIQDGDIVVIRFNK